MSQASEPAGAPFEAAAPGAIRPGEFSAAVGAWRVLLGVFLGLLLGGELHAAQVVFDPANYTALVSSGSSETIEPGTQITLGNWQHYKRYLPFGIQVLYSGQYLWHVGSTPDF
ncbi:MAG TPA: hypothetical protein VGH29_20520, partial [Candidatus Binataceae bacterium]